MKSESVDKYLETFTKIKDLDKKVEVLSKMAATAANSDIESVLNINLKDLNKKEEYVESDNDVITNFNNYIAGMFGPQYSARLNESMKPKYHHSYQHNLSNKSLLRILAVLIEDIKEEREKLVVSLNVK